MNPQIKALWLAELRSGRYKQGKANLCSVDTETNEKQWCCLGVLMDLAVVAGITQAPIRWIGDVEALLYADSEGEWLEGAVLTSKVMEWAGMDDPRGDFLEGNGTLNSLSSINDDGASFEKIAQIIEEKF